MVPLSHSVGLRYFLDRGLYPHAHAATHKRARRALPGASSRSERRTAASCRDTEGKVRGLRVRASAPPWGCWIARRAPNSNYRSVRAAFGMAARALSPLTGPPAYLRRFAAERGLVLDRLPLGVWAAGAYSRANSCSSCPAG